MSRVLDVNGVTGGYGSVQILNGVDLYVCLLYTSPSPRD